MFGSVVVEPTPPKNISQNENLPQTGVTLETAT